MKINFDTILKDMDGEDMITGINSDQVVRKIAAVLEESGSITKADVEELFKKKKPLTLTEIGKAVLTMNFNDEKDLSGDDKLNRFVLACKIRGGGECDLAIDEIALIKKLIGKAYGPLIVGQAWMMIEGKEV